MILKRQVVTRQNFNDTGGAWVLKAVEVVEVIDHWVVKTKGENGEVFQAFDSRGKANLAAQSLLQIDDNITEAYLLSADGEVVHVI